VPRRGSPAAKEGFKGRNGGVRPLLEIAGLSCVAGAKPCPVGAGVVKGRKTERAASKNRVFSIFLR
jgi:hypothetical protein